MTLSIPRGPLQRESPLLTQSGHSAASGVDRVGGVFLPPLLYGSQESIQGGGGRPSAGAPLSPNGEIKVPESAPEAGVGDCLVGKSFYYTERTRRRDNAGDAESGRRQYIPKLLRRSLLASDCQQQQHFDVEHFCWRWSRITPDHHLAYQHASVRGKLLAQQR